MTDLKSSKNKNKWSDKRFKGQGKLHKGQGQNLNMYISGQLIHTQILQARFIIISHQTSFKSFKIESATVLSNKIYQGVIASKRPCPVGHYLH